LAMPDQYKDPTGDAVKSYRAYYLSPEKRRIASWKKLRPAPHWYGEETSPSTPGLRHEDMKGLRPSLRRVRLTRLNIPQG
jgi:hypothetical protein